MNNLYVFQSSPDASTCIDLWSLVNCFLYQYTPYKKAFIVHTDKCMQHKKKLNFILHTKLKFYFDYRTHDLLNQ